MTAIEEVDGLFNSLNEFFSNQVTYLTSGGAYPELTDVLSNLSYTEVLSYLNDNLSGPSSFSLGAAEEALFTMAAISREVEMSKLRKNSLYGDISSEHGNESEYYNSIGAFLSGVVSGSSTNGSMS